MAAGDRFRIGGRVFTTLVVLLLGISVLTASCGDDDDASGSASSGQTADDASADDEDDLVTASDDVVTACRDQDRDRLRDLSGDQLRDRLNERDALFSEVDAVTVVAREVSVEGDTATVTLTLEVTVGDETTEVERVWAYDKVDGAWVLSEVPDCIFG